MEQFAGTAMSITSPEDPPGTELFVQMVQDAPILWNVNLAHYRNAELKDQKWNEVGAHFKLSGTDAYKRFAFLREKYKRQKQIAESKKWPPNECWRLYDKLNFLEPDSVVPDRHYEKLNRDGQGRPVYSWTSPIRSPENSVASPSLATPFQRNTVEQFSESFQSNSAFNNVATVHDPNSKEVNDLIGKNFESTQEPKRCRPGIDSHASSVIAKFLTKLEQKTNTMLDDCSRRFPGGIDTHDSSRTAQFLTQLEQKIDAILDDCSRRNAGWERCNTLGNHIAQTMYALEKNDPDLALNFDIMLSEAITNVRKHQLQRKRRQE